MSNWRKEPVSIDLVRKLNESFKVDYITASLLARREIKEPRQVRFVLESDVAYLHNPFLFAEMEAFVERVLEAQQNREKVGLYFEVTRERIRQIEAKALRRLRHPKRSRRLKDFI
jgi:hypothetical protein